MHLKITSPTEKIFEGDIEKVVVPTESWYLGILPGHMPLSSLVKPGIVRVLAKELDKKVFIEKSKFLFEKDEIKFTVGKGLLYIDGNNVLLNATSSSMDGEYTKKELKERQKKLKKKVEKFKKKWNIEKIEESLVKLEKVSADLKLLDQKDEI